MSNDHQAVSDWLTSGQRHGRWPRRVEVEWMETTLGVKEAPLWRSARLAGRHDAQLVLRLIMRADCLHLTSFCHHGSASCRLLQLLMTMMMMSSVISIPRRSASGNQFHILRYCSLHFYISVNNTIYTSFSCSRRTARRSSLC